MPLSSSQSSEPKKRTDLSISEAVLLEAKALGINLSQSAEVGIRQAITSAKREQWLAENESAINSSNAFVEQSGMPLAQYRYF
ncbi:type II toxin-antitoxin system CcdA family antitoxin [Aliiglaciecola sp. CAU 1673]|uniref:type II toxin-antitoxin system CcdA family antitoxin n=1 Tax=Aliiglaciecola sp. CAU 1673 TaxID=3032595 RepID=UPI0023DA2E2A|nr:type II toxin-antitoxin system CcdA family antitoxin [Aliiglaciecola sp. CAU 1673]MDF2176873.1 type II toxin-antitoxin system CcdA family antitoxin [Aliiglaciecola sp. CAU 1673]